MKDPFDWIDNLEIRILGLDLNWLRASHESRFGVVMVALYAAARWQLGGFDSGIAEYGTSLHWSFFVIYSLEYLLLSTYYEEYLNIVGSRNFFYSAILTMFSVALFEWWWSISYGQVYDVWLIFQDLELLAKNCALTLVGLLCLYHVTYETSWKIRLDVYSGSAAWAFCFVAFVWYAGLDSTFPQTVYPQLDGSLLYVENNLVHLLNTLTKLLMALACSVAFMFKEKIETRGVISSKDKKLIT